MKRWKKLISVITLFSLLVNSLSLPTIALAQELESQTPQPTEESTPSPEATVEPTPEESQTPQPTEESTPSPEATVEPTEEANSNNDDAAQVEVTPTPTENAQSQAPPSTTPEASPTPSETPTNTESEGQITTTIIQDINPFPETVTENSWFKLITDKLDYAPTETAIISGSNFEANKTYELTVSSSDNPATSTTVNVTTNSNGEFTYAYQLDGIYRPDYKVEVRDGGEVVATTTFTDSLPVSGETVDSGGVNDEPGQKDLTKMFADYAGLPNSVFVKWNWDEIRWNGANTGDGCALFDTDNDGLVNYSLCVIISGNPATYQSKALYSCGDAANNKCTSPVATVVPSANTTCSAAGSTDDPFPTGNESPKDTQAQCTISLADVGGVGIANLVDVCSYPSQQPNSDPSDCIVFKVNSGKLQVDKVLVPSNDSGLFNLQIDGVNEATNISNNGTTGENVVSVANHTVGEIAGTNTSLSNYSSSIVCKDLNGTGTTVASSSNSGPLNVNVTNGSDIVCTITNTRVNNGTITIVKDAAPNDAQDFSFTTTGTGLSNFSLDDDADNTLSNTKVFSNLASGVYSVSESATTGWNQTSATCSDGSTVDAINLSSGENVTCTFINSRLPKLTVTKVVTNDNEGVKQISDFPLFVNGNSVISGVKNTYSTGSYIVSETADSGYTAVISGDCDTQGNVTLAYGDDKSCTITNDDKAGHLIVNKITIPEDNEEEFTITASGSGTIQGLAEQTIVSGTPVDYTVDAGTYSVVESVKEGWEETSNTCDDVVVANGETEECTITNTQQGKIIVNKETTPDGSTQDFEFVSNYSSNFTLSDGEQNESAFLTPATYSVSENTPSGWVLSSATCSDGSEINDIELSAGEVVTCTFNNTELGKIFVEKQTLPDGSNEVFEFQTDYGPNFELSDGQSNDSGYLEPGTGYSVSENQKAGWDLDSVTCSDNSNPSNIDLSAGEEITCTFNNSQRGSILGTKFEDVDGTTVTTEDRSSVAGWGIELYTCASDFTGCVLSLSTTTDINGDYSFGNLVSGYYQVKEILTDGWYNLTSLFTNITLDPGEISEDNDFINFEKATIVVHKDVLNPEEEQTDDSTVFKVEMNDSNEENISEGNEVTYDNLLPGTYTITESLIPSGYELVSITNDGVVEVESGETHHVYVVNKQKVAKLTVIKTVINDNGGELESSDFTMSVEGENPSDTSFAGSDTGTVIDLYAGEYSANEQEILGYTKTLGDNCSGTISWGEEKTCTITNDDNQGTLIVEKVIIGGNSTFTDFAFQINNGSETSFDEDGVVESNVDAGTYTVTEPTVEGYTTSYENCTGVEITNSGSQTCTITNTRDTGEIIIKKIIDEDGDLETTEDQTLGIDWEMDVDGNSGDVDNPTGGNTNENGEYETGEVKTGSYFASETQQDGYDFVAATCSDESNINDIQVGKDETVTCTFYNTPNGAIHGVKWNDVDGDGNKSEEELLGDWTIELYKIVGEGSFLVDTTTTHNEEGFDFGWYWFDHLFPGTYKVCEVLQNGWLQTYPSTEDGCHTITLPQTEGQFIENAVIAPIHDFGNYQPATIGDFIWEDVNGDAIQDLGEPAIAGVTANLYKDDGDGIFEPGTDDVFIGTDTTGVDGLYLFEELLPGDYWVEIDDSTVPAGYFTTTPDPYLINDLDPAEDFMLADFGYVPPQPEVSIEKSNNKNNASKGDTVTYTLAITNSGNIGLNDVQVYDALPGGFSYVLGTSKFNGTSVGDPIVNANNLNWTIESLSTNEEFVITYDVKISDSVGDGSYKNLATCTAEVTRVQSTIECNVVDSTVTIGSGVGYGGNLVGQVLGASTELPATGNPTWLLFAALTGLVGGVLLKKKYAKN